MKTIYYSVTPCNQEVGRSSEEAAKKAIFAHVCTCPTCIRHNAKRAMDAAIVIPETR